MTSWGDLLKEYCNGQVDEVPSLYLRRNIFYPVENEKSVSIACECMDVHVCVRVCVCCACMCLCVYECACVFV